MTPQNRFWVGLACAAIVIGLSAWQLFGMPALGLAPRPGMGVRVAFGVGLLAFVVPALAKRVRQRID